MRGAVALNFLKLVALTAIVGGAWAALGWLLDGFYGLVLFLFASLLVGTAVVWHGERLLLAMLHAREVPLGELPHVHSTLERIALKARVPKPRLYVIEDGHPRSLSPERGRGAAGSR